MARKAIRIKNWIALKEISTVFVGAFPELLDGKLYLAEYYKRTGQVERSDLVLSEAGITK
jgi:hypothetical protein